MCKTSFLMHVQDLILESLLNVTVKNRLLCKARNTVKLQGCSLLSAVRDLHYNGYRTQSRGGKDNIERKQPSSISSTEYPSIITNHPISSKKSHCLHPYYNCSLKFALGTDLCTAVGQCVLNGLHPTHPHPPSTMYITNV